MATTAVYSGFEVAGGVATSYAAACMANGLATDPVRGRTFRRVAGGVTVLGLVTLLAVIVDLSASIIVSLATLALLAGLGALALAWMGSKKKDAAMH